MTIAKAKLCQIALKLRTRAHLTKPIIQQMLLVLGQHKEGELHTLIGVQFPLGQESAKIHKQWRGLPRDGRHSLKLVNGVFRTESSLQGKHSSLRSSVLIDSAQICICKPTSEIGKSKSLLH